MRRWTIGVLAATAVAIAAVLPGLRAAKAEAEAAPARWTLVVSPDGVSLQLDSGRVVVTFEI